MKLSVIICSYNPKKDYLMQVMESLSCQSLSLNEWELIIIDNNSDELISNWVDIKWHINSSIVRERRAGLSYARLKGVSIAKGELIVFADDDNLLERTYLEKSLNFSEKNLRVGCFGGKSLPIFETTPPEWFFKTGINLGCQEFGNTLYISNFASSNFELREYPQLSPIGTGMVIRKQAFLKYLNEVENSPKRLSLGRKGKSLTSGEDNDIILSIVKHGYEIAYLPELLVKHLIPTNRIRFNYLKKMAYESNRSWVKVLSLHKINPWKPISAYTLKLREIKAYVVHRAWQKPENYIKWKSACGLFKGLSELAKNGDA